MARLQKNRMKRGVGRITIGVVGEIAHPTIKERALLSETGRSFRINPCHVKSQMRRPDEPACIQQMLMRFASVR